ncbi:MAG: HAD family phosphatase [Anaerolineae bacterium]|nr:HAD family phosphatase [Anaerolineae bacterium]
MIRAVIFDMDGLLVDSEPLWQQARVESFGADRLRWTETDQTAVMGTGQQQWAEYLAQRLEHVYSPEEIIDRVVTRMEAYYRSHVPLLPGAREAVQRAAERYPLGLASGSSHRLIRAVLESTGWAGLFAEVMSSEDVPQGKPAPDIYLEITRRLGIRPEEAAVLEDSANGILSGHAAGVRVIAVPGDYLSPPDGVLRMADRVLSSLEDFSPEMLSDL